MKKRSIQFHIPLIAMIVASVFLTRLPAVFAEEILTASTPIVLLGPAGKFDFMAVDSVQNRILAAHTGAGTLEIIDLASGKPLQAVNVGDAQGVAVDGAGKRYFLGNEKKASVVTINAENFSKVSETKVDGPVDAVAYDSKNGMVYAAKDDGTILWVVDPKAAKVVATVALPGVPEVLEYDTATDRLYVNIKDKDLVARIDPTTNKVDAKWTTLPATSPHGLAVDSSRGRLYIAGANGKLVALDRKSGSVLSSTNIPRGVDQIAFDSVSKRIYSACKGSIGISEDQDSGLRSLGSAPSPKGAHTLAVAKDVWVSFSDDSHSYLKKLEVNSKRN